MTRSYALRTQGLALVAVSITTNTKISLYNKKTNSYVIHAERDHGINLRWNTDVYKARDHRK